MDVGPSPIELVNEADAWAMESTDQAILERALASFQRIGIPWARLFRVERTTRGNFLRGVAQFSDKKLFNSQAERGKYIEEFRGQLPIDPGTGSSLADLLDSLLTLYRPTLVQVEKGEPPQIRVAQDGPIQVGVTGNEDWPAYLTHFQAPGWIEVPICHYFGPVGLLSLPGPANPADRGELLTLLTVFKAFAAPMLWNLERDDKQKVLFRIFNHDLSVWDLEQPIDRIKADLDRCDRPEILGLKEEVDLLAKRFEKRRAQIERLKHIASTMTRPKSQVRVHHIDLPSTMPSLIRSLEVSFARSIFYTPTEGVPSVVVDEATLEFVLSQLCDNSFKHQATQVWIKDTIAGDCVRLHFYDNGAGIPPERLARLGEQDVVSTSNGMGIALVACNFFLSYFGSRLFADSEQPADGALMTIEFQRVKTPGNQNEQ